MFKNLFSHLRDSAAAVQMLLESSQGWLVGHVYCWPNPQHHLHMPGRLTTVTVSVLVVKNFYSQSNNASVPLQLLRLSHPFIMNNEHSLSKWRWRKDTEIAFSFFIGLHLFTICVSAVQGSESAVHIHISPASMICLPPPNPLHPSRLAQSTQLSSLCYRAGPH